MADIVETAGDTHCEGMCNDLVTRYLGESFTTHPSKDDMLAIQMGRGAVRDEELAAVGVGPRVGAAQEARRVVRELEVLVLKGAAIDALPARAVRSREVATLHRGGTGVIHHMHIQQIVNRVLIHAAFK